MTVYFVFSDEAGEYKKLRSMADVTRSPYYCRCGLVISTDDWTSLKDGHKKLKEKWSIPQAFELKWEHLWQATRLSKEEISQKFPKLNHLPAENLIPFVEECLGLLASSDSCKLVFTVTSNDGVGSIGEDKIWKMHLQDIMQRVEMQICKKNENLAVFFLDNVSKKKEENMREWYNELLNGGDLMQYTHVKDSISFERSHHSFAMQLADYSVGVFNGMLRGYEDSCRIFKTVFPKVVKHRSSDEFMGYGILEVPTDKGTVRPLIRNHINGIVSRKERY